MDDRDLDLAVSEQILIIDPTPGKLFPDVCMETLSLTRVGWSSMKLGATYALIHSLGNERHRPLD